MKIVKNNLITESTENVYKVKTPITISLIGETYPIHDEDGKLYRLDEHDMSTFYLSHGDTIPFLIDGNIHAIETAGYEFEVSPNEETAFLTVEMAFKVHAYSEENAINKLYVILCDTKNTLLDFSIHDFNAEEEYRVDVLCYELSGLYKARRLS